MPWLLYERMSILLVQHSHDLARSQFLGMEPRGWGREVAPVSELPNILLGTGMGPSPLQRAALFLRGRVGPFLETYHHTGPTEAMGSLIPLLNLQMRTREKKLLKSPPPWALRL